MRKLVFAICSLLVISNITYGQDVFATVTVNGNAIQNVDQKIFSGLDQKLTEFINQRRWTTDEFAADERLQMNINLTFVSKENSSEDLYQAKLTVQATRPVYGTDYSTSLINLIDKDVTIRYSQFQVIDFNDNRVTGNDIYQSNFSAIIAFYVYYALGLDYDSYSLKGGTTYFNKALNIVQNAPELSGWKREGNKGRYWLVDNILNSRFDNFRVQFYEYHRNGLDQLSTDKAAAMAVIKNNIKLLAQLNTDLPNAAAMNMYFTAKSKEYLAILTEASPQEKEELIPLMASLDVTNSAKYLELQRAR